MDVLDDWHWTGADGGWWTLTCRLTVGVDSSACVPRRSDWKVLADPRYPRGPIHLQPAIDNAIAETFQHQNLNRAPGRDAPWRSGRICVDTGVRALGRVGRAALDGEPYDPENRLAWYLQRARIWLLAAAAGELARPGDPFELPDFGVRQSVQLGFSENVSSLQSWEGESADCGFVHMRRLAPSSKAIVVDRFTDLKGREVYVTHWGRHLQTTGVPEPIGIWIRFSDVPRLTPWRAPITWGELRSIANEQRVPIDDILVQLLGGLGDGAAHLLLIGFPIPDVAGAPSATMFWQAAQLKALPSVERRGGRQRSHRLSIPLERLRQFHNDEPVDWIRSENWHDDTVAARGRLPEALRTAEVFVIGAGALGSVVAELLVRGGVRALTICDDETLSVGNLVRHTLTLADVGRLKANALAARLNTIRLDADVRAVPKRFPPTSDEGAAALLRTADVIIDCTGEDDVAAAMADYSWNGPKVFASISLGMRAQAGFSYVAYGDAFPFDAFSAVLRPVLDEQATSYAGMEWPREGVGCWHPVFPARIDEVWLLANAAVAHLAEYATEVPTAPELAVFERDEEDGKFAGLRRRAGARDADA